MKKLGLLTLLLAAISSFAEDRLDRKIINLIEMDYNVTCGYDKTSDPCLINYNCTSKSTYSCLDANEDKRVGIEVWENLIGPINI